MDTNEEGAGPADLLAERDRRAEIALMSRKGKASHVDPTTANSSGRRDVETNCRPVTSAGTAGE